MKRITSCLIFTIMMCTLFAAPVWETPASIRIATNLEWSRYSAETSDGCVICLWTDTHRGDRDVYAQKVNSSGQMMWAQPLLVVGKPGAQEAPVIIKTSDNHFIIAWLDRSTDPDGDVYAQKINAVGQLQWIAEGKNVCTAPGIQNKLNIEPDAAGGAFIVWEDYRNFSIDLFGQHINQQGTALWNIGGLPIAGATGDEKSTTMWADGSGGLVLGYIYQLSGVSNIYVKRLSVDGNIQWSLPLSSGSDDYYNPKLSMVTVNSNSLFFCWDMIRNDNVDIYAQRISLTGNIIWGTPVAVYSDSLANIPYPQTKPRIVRTSDDQVIIAWEDYRANYDDPDLYAQKLNLSGELQWDSMGVVVCAADYTQRDPRLVSDSNGGCFITWDDARNGNFPNCDIYAQHISATGSILWETNGMPISTAAGEQSGVAIRISGGNLYVSWADYRTGSAGLYYQVLSTAGNLLLAQDGQMIYDGISGSVNSYDYQLLPRSQGTVSLWVDTRGANNGYQIYYQFINPDGSTVFEPNGRAVTHSSGEDQSNFAALVLPNDQLAVVWEENNCIRGQLLTATGIRLWGDYGIVLSGVAEFRQKDPKISYEDGALYIGWSDCQEVITDQGFRYLYRVYAQKIVDNQLLWGDGILVSVPENGNENFESNLESLVGRYFVWVNWSLDMDSWGYSNIYVKQLNPDGSTAAGWQAAGLAASIHFDWDTYQFSPRAVMTDAGLFIVWKDLRTDFMGKMYGQLISSSGNRLWDELGVAISNSGNEQSNFSVLGGSSLTFCWEEVNPGQNCKIKYQSYSLSGNPLWGEYGQYAYADEANLVQDKSQISRFANGGYIITWQQYQDNGEYYSDKNICCRYLNPDGYLIGNATGYNINPASDDQICPLLAIVGNDAYLSWLDSDLYYDAARCGEEEYENFGIYLQKLSNECVAVEEQELPSAEISLEQNSPNPFNPSTRIGFSLTKNSDVELSVYNLKGQKVTTLVEANLPKGRHSIVWNSIDYKNKSVSSGVYFYRLSSGTASQTRKMMLMK